MREGVEKWERKGESEKRCREERKDTVERNVGERVSNGRRRERDRV